MEKNYCGRPPIGEGGLAAPVKDISTHQEVLYCSALGVGALVISMLLFLALVSFFWAMLRRNFGTLVLALTSNSMLLFGSDVTETET